MIAACPLFIGVDFGGRGNPGARPTISEKRPCIYQFLPHFPQNLSLPSTFLTSLCQCLYPCKTNELCDPIFILLYTGSIVYWAIMLR